MKEQSQGKELFSILFNYLMPLAMIIMMWNEYETTTFLVLLILSIFGLAIKNTILRIMYIAFIGLALPIYFIFAFPYLPEQLQYIGNENSFDAQLNDTL